MPNIDCTALDYLAQNSLNFDFVVNDFCCSFVIVLPNVTRLGFCP